MLLMFHQILLVESLWDVDSCRLVSVGSGPVCSLLGLEDSVWASCANRVTVIQESSLQTQVDPLSRDSSTFDNGLKESRTCVSRL